MTLVELLVVIAIIGVLVAMVLPGVSTQEFKKIPACSLAMLVILRSSMECTQVVAAAVVSFA
jgi:prepilin-type N-terminal cleavage/methylation domain-containing protein